MSLRARVVVLIGTVLFVSMMLGAMVAGYQAKQALRAELDAGLKGAEQTVRSAFEDLPNSDHPLHDLRQLVATFDGNRHVKAVLLNAGGRPIDVSQTDVAGAKAPTWFQQLLESPRLKIEMRVPESVPEISAIILTPTANLDAGSAWQELSGVIIVIAISSAIGLGLVYLVIGAAFQPLAGLSAGFARIGTGDYAARVREDGPTELLSLQQGFNVMAAQLAGTTDRNRLLTEQLLTIQDEERADIARDLHDEIGPHLFGVNMDAQMIMQLNEAGRHDAVTEQVQSIKAAVGHMQRQVRDLLGRLRPTSVTEFGLRAAISDLVRFWEARRPDIVFDWAVTDEDDLFPEAVKEAAYRIVQEAANNAVRHGNPKTIRIAVEVEDRSDVLVTVLDDGVNPGAQRESSGLGLLGMRERTTALGGSLTFGRTAGAVGWSVIARLPLHPFAAKAPRAVATS